MKELLLYIARSLVDNPDEVTVIESETDDGGIRLELRVAQGDMGKVIGKQGRTSKEIRTLVRAAAAQGQRIVVDIVD